MATRGNQRTAATVMHSGKQIPGLSVSRKRCLRFASSSTQFPVARFASFTVAIRSFATLSDGPVRVEQRQMADANVKEDNDAGAGVEQTPAARDEEALGQDPESDEDVNVDPEELKEALSRPPPVNSDYLPLPWKGRLGYVRLLHLSILLFFGPLNLFVLTISGLFEHLFALRKPSGLLLTNVSHRFHS